VRLRQEPVHAAEGGGQRLQRPRGCEEASQGTRANTACSRLVAQLTRRAAAQAAKAASGGKGERPRDKLRAEAIERARKFDEDRGRGGGEKKKGGWPF